MSIRLIPSLPSSASRPKRAGRSRPASRKLTGKAHGRASYALGWVQPLVILGLGAGLGLAATAFALSHRLDPAAVRNGPWTTWPAVGTAAIDPYAKAIQARTAEVPLAASVGVSFLADRDSAGAPLTGRCTYRIDGTVPFARRWTLGLDTVMGQPFANPAQRYGFTSGDVLRREGGGFDIMVSQTVQPGNWLPAPAGAFLLSLRLYGTSLGATSADLGSAPMPAITAESCRR